MANRLFEFLTNTGNKIKSTGSSLFDKLTNKNSFEEYANQIQPLQSQQPIEFIQLTGGPSVNSPMPENPVTFGDRVKNRINIAGGKLYEGLMGKQAQPTDTIGNMTDDTINATISNNPRTGGLLRDFAGGYQENRWTPVSLDNFGQNTLANGRKKGFGYRAGEFLGSLARIGESPLGRGLITAGIIGASGGSGLEALAYGGQAGALNQRYRNNDRMYRNDLITNQQNALKNSDAFNNLSEAEKAQVLQNMQNDENYIKSTDENAKAKMLADAENQYLYNRQAQQLEDIENNINSMRGYVTDDTYNNFIRSQQLRENADWRKFYYDDQKEERKLSRELAQQEREYQHQQDAIKTQLQRETLAQQAADRAATRAITMRGQDLNYATSMANLDARKNQITASDRKAAAKEQQSMNTINMINQALNTVKSNPNAFKFTTGIMGGDIANRLDPKGVQARSVVNSVTAEYRKYLTGAQMSDKERKYYEKFLPAPTDNARIIQDKLNGMLTVISAREGVNVGSSSMPQVDRYALQAEMKRRGLL